MTIQNAFILSLVEGFTEFLPISSTGHMILAAKLLSIPSSNFLKSFEIIIQLGAIMTISLKYFNLIIKQKRIIKSVFISFIPTSIFGFAFYKIIKQYLLGNVLITLISLITGGILFIIFEKFWIKDKKPSVNMESLTWKQSLIIGLIQSISLIPGISRSAASIFGGIYVGLSRVQAVEFSFILAIPTIFAATLYDLINSSFYFTQYEWSLIVIGFLGSAASAWIVISFFIRYIQKNTFISFGIYRIALALIFSLFIL